MPLSLRASLKRRDFVAPGSGAARRVTRMRRREFIKLLTSAAIAGPRAAIAQSSSKVFRLGTLTPGAPLDEKTPLGSILLKALEQHGYTLGKNLSLEARGAGGQVSKLGEIVRGMKTDNVDVIVAVSYPATFACKIEKVPTVVAYGCGDPVATHLIDGLARPGGTLPAFRTIRRRSPPSVSRSSSRRSRSCKGSRCCGTGTISACRSVMRLPPVQRNRSGQKCRRSACAT